MADISLAERQELHHAYQRLVSLVPTKLRPQTQPLFEVIDRIVSLQDGRSSFRSRDKRHKTNTTRRESEVFELREALSHAHVQVVGWTALCEVLRISEGSLRCMFSRGGGHSFTTTRPGLEDGLVVVRTRAYADQPGDPRRDHLARLAKL